MARKTARRIPEHERLRDRFFAGWDDEVAAEPRPDDKGDAAYQRGRQYARSALRLKAKFAQSLWPDPEEKDEDHNDDK